MFRIPKLQHHRASGQGRVLFDGKHLYFGRYGSAKCEAEYRRFCAELAASNRPGKVASAVTVDEVLASAWLHVERYYVKNGRATSEQQSFNRSFHFARKLYGDIPADEFGPIALKTVREEVIKAGFTRKSVNKHIARIRHAFRLAVENELIDGNVLHRLQAVRGLKAGRTEVPDRPPIQPVSDNDINAVAKHVSRQVWAMIRLQRLTGMRPGEVLIMRACDLDMSGRTWTYRPSTHKTEHHGQSREVPIGPKGQKALRPFLTGDADRFLFSPADAERERLDKRHAARVTPANYGNRPGTNRKKHPRRTPQDRYDIASYRRAIHRACKLAGIATWSPNRLRHTAATELRRAFGIEAARIALGHRRIDTTELYAAKDREAIVKIMAEVG